VSRTVKIPVLHRVATQEILGARRAHCRIFFRGVASLRAPGPYPILALHCATRSVHRDTWFSID
jgi:hypothetical protein